MSEISDKTNDICIIVNNKENSHESKSMFPSPRQIVGSTVRMSTDVIKQNLSCFIDTFNDILDSVPNSCEKGYELDQLTCSLSIDGSGRIALIGELSSTVQSGITITFKKKDRA